MKHEIIEPVGLSVTAAAQVLGVTRATLSTLLNERASLSPEMALRIEKAFGVSMDTLMRMQNSYDIAQTRERADKIKVRPYSKRVDRTTSGQPLIFRARNAVTRSDRVGGHRSGPRKLVILGSRAGFSGLRFAPPENDCVNGGSGRCTDPAGAFADGPPHRRAGKPRASMPPIS